MIKWHHIFVFFTLLCLISCKSPKPSISSVNDNNIEIKSNEIDSSFYKTILPYKTKHDNLMTKVIAQSDDALIKADLESTLGNFFCDAVLIETKKILKDDSIKVDVAVFNKGGLRNSLPKGNITVGNIFELMPFDNELVLLQLSGKQFADMMYKIIDKGGIPIGGFRMTIKGTKFENVTVNGEPFDESKNYWVITSDYLANGGDSYVFFKNALYRKNLNLLLRDIIINHCEDLTKQQKMIKAKLDGRIQLSK
jgi:2',3'-cyclic-nucleotide 2'-phosphodiesterase (5'-nucleotidase family)